MKHPVDFNLYGKVFQLLKGKLSAVGLPQKLGVREQHCVMRWNKFVKQLDEFVVWKPAQIIHFIFRLRITTIAIITWIVTKPQ